jgi:hypothetical protein
MAPVPVLLMGNQTSIPVDIALYAASHYRLPPLEFQFNKPCNQGARLPFLTIAA